MNIVSNSASGTYILKPRECFDNEEIKTFTDIEWTYTVHNSVARRPLYSYCLTIQEKTQQNRRPARGLYTTAVYIPELNEVKRLIKDATHNASQTTANQTTASTAHHHKVFFMQLSTDVTLLTDRINKMIRPSI
jgi:c-di-AMP phosphodiesterase-like protein